MKGAAANKAMGRQAPLGGGKEVGNDAGRVGHGGGAKGAGEEAEDEEGGHGGAAGRGGGEGDEEGVGGDEENTAAVQLRERRLQRRPDGKAQHVE